MASEPAPLTSMMVKPRPAPSSRRLSKRTSKRPKRKSGMSRATASMARTSSGVIERRAIAVQPAHARRADGGQRTCCPAAGTLSGGTLHWWRGERVMRRARTSAATSWPPCCGRRRSRAESSAAPAR
jgi:hypothetical protein